MIQWIQSHPIYLLIGGIISLGFFVAVGIWFVYAITYLED